MDRRELERSARCANHGFMVSLVVIFVLMAAGCLVAGLLTPAGADFLIVGIGAAVVFLLIALACLAIIRPRRLRRLRLDVRPQTVARGDDVTVTLERARARKPIEIGLVGARVELGGTSETGIWESRDVIHEEWSEVAAGERLAVRRIRVPDRVSPSFRATHARTAWTIVARRRRGRFAARTTHVIEVVKDREALAAAGP